MSLVKVLQNIPAPEVALGRRHPWSMPHTLCPCNNKEFVKQILQELWGSQLHPTSDSGVEKGFDRPPCLPGHPSPLSEPKSGHQLDPEWVLRTWQAGSGAAESGAEALLCFVSLCMQDTLADVQRALKMRWGRSSSYCPQPQALSFPGPGSAVSLLFFLLTHPKCLASFPCMNPCLRAGVKGPHPSLAEYLLGRRA